MYERSGLRFEHKSLGRASLISDLAYVDAVDYLSGPGDRTGGLYFGEAEVCCDSAVDYVVIVCLGRSGALLYVWDGKNGKR